MLTFAVLWHVIENIAILMANSIFFFMVNSALLWYKNVLIWKTTLFLQDGVLFMIKSHTLLFGFSLNNIDPENTMYASTFNENQYKYSCTKKSSPFV